MSLKFRGSPALRILAALPILLLAGCGLDSTTTGPGTPRPQQVAPGDGDGVAAGGSPVVESVTGSAHILISAGLFRRISFNVKRYEDGRVDGEWELVAGAAVIHGEPTCFTIDGSTVRIGGVVEFSPFTLNVAPGSEFIVQVSDNGEGSGDPEDGSSRVVFNVDPGGAGVFCETGEAPIDLPFFPIKAGDVVIHQ